MSNGGLPTNIPPRNPVVPVNQAPQIPIEYQRSRELIDSLWNDSSVGPAIRKMAKEKYNITTQDDAVEPIVAPLKKQLEELTAKLTAADEARAKAEKEAAEKSASKSLEDAINSARDKYHLTAEGFDKMIARMKETGNISDADAAAAWVRSNEPPAAPNTPSWAPKNIDLKGNLDKEMVALLHSDPVAFQDLEIQEMLKDPDKYVRETFGQAA